MTEIQVVPIDEQVAKEVRATLISPGDGCFPAAFCSQSLVLDAYRDGRRLRVEKVVEGTDAQGELGTLLSRSDIDYVHVRSVTASCYLFTVRAA